MEGKALPCLYGRGDTQVCGEAVVTHWGCSSVDEERRIPVLPALLLSSFSLHRLALCRCPLPPQAFLGTGTIVTHFPSDPLLWNKGTVR